jgi:hypothetical protein
MWKTRGIKVCSIIKSYRNIDYTCDKCPAYGCPSLTIVERDFGARLERNKLFFRLRGEKQQSSVKFDNRERRERRKKI